MEARKQAYYDWRKRVNKHIPKIASRVFALRDKHYRGAGLHYDMEHRLGKLIACMNDYRKPFAHCDAIIERVLAEALLRDLVLAEFSARGRNFPIKD